MAQQKLPLHLLLIQGCTGKKGEKKKSKTVKKEKSFSEFEMEWKPNDSVTYSSATAY